MKEKISFWLGVAGSVIALLAVIFNFGSIYNRFGELESKVVELEKQNSNYEKVLNTHFGHDWQKNLANIKSADHFQDAINDKASSLQTIIGENQNQLNSTKRWVLSIREWAEQQDALVRQETLDKFRAISIYANYKSQDTFKIKINKQDLKGTFYKKGDRVLIENPKPPGLSVEVYVDGFIDDPNSSDVLVQMNESLLKELGLSTWDGRYELFVTNDKQVLRWKSLESVYTELN